MRLRGARGSSLAIATLLLAAPTANGATSCTEAGPGGDWRLAGHDLSNTRNQPAESRIGPANASRLTLRWGRSLARAAGARAGTTSDLEGTPVEAGGCVYVASALGEVMALDVRNGHLAWRRTVHVARTGLGGTFVGSPAIAGRLLVLLANREGSPIALALDRTTGARVWTSGPFVRGPLYYTNATPVVANGVVIAGYSPPEGEPDGQGGVALLDVHDGRLLANVPSVPPARQARGYAGGGMWTTPAVDTTTGYAYYGVGNPYSKKIEDPRTNAILKLDVDPARATFGEVVRSYKGNIEQVTPLLRTASRPSCNLIGEDGTLRQLPRRFPQLRQFQQFLANGIGCLQLDMDFGAAPNLFTVGGRTLVGELQKSGVYHAVDATTMRPAWSRMIGISCEFCNAASTAVADGKVLAAVSPGSLMAAIDAADGAVRWYSLIGGGFQYQPVSAANGVAYTIDNLGILHAYDAARGRPLLTRVMALDGAPDAIDISSGGVAIARGLVLVSAGSHVLAYGL